MSDSEDSTDPPSLDYVPGLEEPKQAPPSPIYVPFIPKPVYPEFLPRDDDLTAEDDEGATDDDDDDDDAEEEEHLTPADPAAVAYSADQDPYIAYRRDALPSPVHETEMPEICLSASSERPVSVLPWSWIQEDDILNSQLDDARPMTSSYIRAPIRWILAISVRSEGILHRTYGVLLSSSRSRRLQASIP
ncbi:hypothetical protein Tco_0892369 [Tanacetum coccineum]|uniref:Uncharacterized protein n=1 Tax=Tanacetum coccineum TaxID=301880 RepID=A0ABQ5C7I4_9ASTR